MRSCVTISLVPAARGGPFVYWDDWEAALLDAESLGFDAVELFPPAPEVVPSARLSEQLARHHLQLAAVGTGAGWVQHQWTLTAADASVRSAACHYIEAIIDYAGHQGASAIIGSMQGRWSDTVGESQARDYLRSALDRLGAHAARHGVPLLYEPLNRYETNLCRTLQQGSALLDSLTSDNVRLLADLFHMNIEEANLEQAIVEAGSRIGHIHFVDSNRQAAGNGHLDFAPIVRGLRQIAYTGYLSAEALPLPTSRLAAEATMRAFRRWVDPLAATTPAGL